MWACLLTFQHGFGSIRQNKIQTHSLHDSANELVYYQGFLSVAEAEQAEKYIKGKKREWKKSLITKDNPHWLDLTDKLER
jgi:predicted GIY-YIG superfamily endonuclease